MNVITQRTKVSVTISNMVVSKVDELVKSGIFESRSAAFENAARELLRARMDAHIEAEVLKLDRDAEIAEAEEGMGDFAKLVNE